MAFAPDEPPVKTSESGSAARWRSTQTTFRALGHQLVDQVAELLESVQQRPITHDESPSAVREALDLNGPLPEHGDDPEALLERTAQLLCDHSLFNGHPRFFGYITAAPAPIGILATFWRRRSIPTSGPGLCRRRRLKSSLRRSAGLRS